MVLGTLSLFQKRGIFYVAQQIYSKESFIDMEEQELKTVHTTISDFNKPAKQHRIAPVEESGNTDYITATFEDQGNANYPYEVTVWLLIEEDKEELIIAHP